MEILTGSDEFLGVNVRCGLATILILLFLLLWQSLRKFLAKPGRSIIPSTDSIVSSNESSETRIVSTISDDDLRELVKNVQGKIEEDIWENIVEKRNNSISYKAWSCKAKDGPLKYLSVTTFENCSTELLRDFYMDNEYRKIWDKTLIEFEQLQIDETNGIEIGRMTKKFPFLTPREYVLAWRLWEGKNKTFYCITKDCEHIRAPRQKKYVRVNFYRSGWRIKKGKFC